MKEQLAALYALQQRDSALDALKKQYAALDAGHTDKAALTEAQAVHTQAAHQLSAINGEIKDLELEKQAIEEKRKDYETRLYSGAVRNPKELQSMQDEVDMLGRQRTRLEEQLLTLAEGQKTAKEAESATKVVVSQARAVLKTKVAAYKQTSEAIVAQARLLVAQRNEAARAIPAPLLQRYETLRVNKGGIAIVALEDSNTCGGCKMGLPSSLVKLIHVGTGIEICQNCRRIVCEAVKTS